MNNFKKGDRVVLEDDSGISIFYKKDLEKFIMKEVRRGTAGVVTCAYDGYVYVKFDGDNGESDRLVERRFVFEEVEVEAKEFKKVFYPCSHDYQELEDDVMSLCFEFGKNVFYKE